METFTLLLVLLGNILLCGVLYTYSTLDSVGGYNSVREKATNPATLGCLNEDGAPADGWTVLKAHDSYEYYVFNADSSSWTKSPYQVDGSNENGCIMSTMSQLYGLNSESGVMAGLYNDEPPVGSNPSSTYAHGKGILATTADAGFWLLHSMPKWPNVLDESGPGGFPSDTNAQSLQCVTISASTADAIAGNLMIARPFIFSSLFTSTLQTVLPKMYSWLNHGYENDWMTSIAAPFKSVGGVEYLQFAKSGKWGKDLWDDLVAPTLQSPMNVETWRDGAGGRMSSICGSSTKAVKDQEYDVYMVSGVTIDGVSWEGTADHSKWGATTADSKKTISCVGDINRMCSQESRGGGAMCSGNKALWSAFNSVIGGVEGCYAYDPCQPYGHSTQCYWCSASG